MGPASGVGDLTRCTTAWSTLAADLTRCATALLTLAAAPRLHSITGYGFTAIKHARNQDALNLNRRPKMSENLNVF